ncbi:MAG: major facilitator superfamily [Chitinophagaceae bacterium]|nr:MAG: major facilitator superfamily [Chitinophagaceae bacterium]
MIKLQIKNDPFVAMRIAEFRNLMIGRFSFIMGLRMLGTLVGWWIYELTNEPFAIGLIGLAEVVPAVSLSLYAGYIIDISEKRKLLLKGIAFYFSCALLLFFLASNFTANQLSKHWIAFSIYIIIFFTGIIRAFTGPTFGTMVASSASVTGHATVGFLIALLGNAQSLMIICIMIAIGFIFLQRIHSKPPLNEKGEKTGLASVKEGLDYVFKTKELLGALSLDLFAVFFGGAVAMIPVFAKDILNVGPVGFGWLNAAADIGSIIIIVLLTFFPLKSGQGKKLLIVVGGFGICIIVFALSKLFWLSFIVLVLSGILDGVSMIIRGTIVQLRTPDHMRGRVMSVNSMFINSSNELGQFESGMAAKLLGVIPSVVFGGSMTLLVVIITWFKAPSLRKMEY